MKTALISAVAVLALATIASAEHPAHNISAGRHPNLSEAQRLCQGAFEKIVMAQKVNEFDMGGHAQKAKDLLEQASNELKQAAETANEHR